MTSVLPNAFAILLLLGMAVAVLTGLQRGRSHRRAFDAMVDELDLELDAPGHASGRVDGVPIEVEMVTAAGADQTPMSATQRAAEQWGPAVTNQISRAFRHGRRQGGGLLLFHLIIALVLTIPVAAAFLWSLLLYAAESAANVRVKAETDAPEALTVELAGWTESFGGVDVKTGDAAFDHAVRVRGPPLTALATLDADARAATRELLSAGGRLSGGTASAVVRSAGTSPVAATRAVVAATKALRGSGSVDRLEAVAARALTDPQPGVRARALHELLSEHQDADVTDTTVSAVLTQAGADPDDADSVAAALEDESESVRLAALVRLAGTASPRHLAAMAALPSDGRIGRYRDVTLAAVRDRVGPEAAGRLTLTDVADQGQVSLPDADDQAGRVTMARKSTSRRKTPG